jgi:hypothetical protein
VEIEDLRRGEGAEFDKRSAQGYEGVHEVFSGLFYLRGMPRFGGMNRCGIR